MCKIIEKFVIYLYNVCVQKMMNDYDFETAWSYYKVIHIEWVQVAFSQYKDFTLYK